MIYYLGTCVDIDEAGENYGFDATEFAQAEERALEADINIDKKIFWGKVEQTFDTLLKGQFEKLAAKKDVWYSQDSYLNVSWAYEPDSDIHYIFEGVVYK